MAEISILDAGGLAVTSWSVADGSLRLRFGDAKDDRTLRCRCGRSHWILETRIRGDRGVLAVRCHNCGTGGQFDLQEFQIPPR